MSRSCAKPTCSSPAATWFDLSRSNQRVTSSATETPHGIALCQVHADRFGVPDGWTLIASQPRESSTQEAASPEVLVEQEPSKAPDETAVDQTQETHREHDRDNPWFVPTAPADQIAAVEGDASQELSPSLSNPSEGSLLHRAFHGPTTAQPTQPPVGEAVVDELSPRRRARSSSDDAEEEATDLYETFELPFPPHARHVAAI